MYKSKKFKIIVSILIIISLLMISLSVFLISRAHNEKNYTQLKADLLSYINNPELVTTGRGFDEQQRQDFLVKSVLPAFIQIADRTQGIDCQKLPSQTTPECSELTNIIAFMAQYYRSIIDLSNEYSYQELQKSSVRSEDQDKLNYINQNQNQLNLDQNRLKQLIQ